MIDVGQGDATLLVFPHQKEVILIDTGGKIDYSTDLWQVRDKNTLTDNLITAMHSLGISKITHLTYNWTVFEILKNRVNIPPYSYCVLKLIKQPLFVIIILGK